MLKTSLKHSYANNCKKGLSDMVSKIEVSQSQCSSPTLSDSASLILEIFDGKHQEISRVKYSQFRSEQKLKSFEVKLIYRNAKNPATLKLITVDFLPRKFFKFTIPKAHTIIEKGII